MDEKLTAVMAEQRDNHVRRTWHWLFDRLKDCVDLRGMRPEDDERLAALHEDTYFEPYFLQDPSGRVGPEVDIMHAFRENAELWLSACPADDHVVVLPRKLIEQLVAARTVSTDGLGAFKLEYAENAGHALLRSGAACKRIEREDRELSEGERLRVKMNRWLDDYVKSNDLSRARDDGDQT